MLAQTATRPIAAQTSKASGEGGSKVTKDEAHEVVPEVRILEGILIFVEDLTKSRVPFLERLHKALFLPLVVSYLLVARSNYGVHGT